MPIAIAIASFLGIAGANALLKRFVIRAFPDVCVVCAGVSATWLWILIAHHAGRLADPRWPTVAAVLLGGSVVGLTEQWSKRRATPFSSTQKALAFAVGFAIAYAAIASWWGGAFAAAIVLARAATFAVRPDGARSVSAPPAVETLKRQLEKECC